MSKRGWLLFSAMAVIWGIPYLLIKVSLRDLTPGTLVFARTGIAAILLLPLAAKRGMLRPLLAKWRILLVYTVVEIAGPWFFLSTAEQRLSSSVSGLLVASVPLIGAVAAIIVGGGGHDDRPDARRILGLLVGLAGVAVLVGVDVGGSDIWAVVAIAITAIGYATGPMIISRKLARPADARSRRGVPGADRYRLRTGRRRTVADAHEREGARLSARSRAHLHGARVHGVLRADRRGRSGEGDSDHLREPGDRAAARRAAAERALHRRYRDRLPADLARLLPGHLAQPRAARDAPEHEDAIPAVAEA